jgi:hypothetical protein
MQLLATFATPDYAAWKADFDAHAEDRANSGLSLMQLWRDADDPAQAVALFDVHNRAAAQDWLKVQAALGHGVTGRFVRTA